MRTLWNAISFSCVLMVAAWASTIAVYSITGDDLLFSIVTQKLSVFPIVGSAVAILLAIFRRAKP